VVYQEREAREINIRLREAMSRERGRGRERERERERERDGKRMNDGEGSTVPNDKAIGSVVFDAWTVELSRVESSELRVQPTDGGDRKSFPAIHFSRSLVVLRSLVRRLRRRRADERRRPEIARARLPNPERTGSYRQVGRPLSSELRQLVVAR